MCEYCKGNKFIYEGIMWDIKIDEFKRLEIVCKDDDFNQVNMTVKYCPMCGERLLY